MKAFLSTLLTLCVYIGFSQTTNLDQFDLNETDTVSFIATVDLKNATKDGIYLNGYVVNITYEEIDKLNGKTIEISGIVTIRKGLMNTPKEYDDKGNEISKQGRNNDVKHIEKPSYRIIKN